ncbi:alanine racemase [Balneolaceae bacterium YR4-1]|uniref:Alanine racemase n=1 Tax=Halalkalibaculum roseum TaxID=2709311 RepID=A0A6M1SWB3_9BACT|nr:alanine racemase [Halalkalibaculum roseum]NGP76376.1 alanine racemase [Halalkalibaculum roseum]
MVDEEKCRANIKRMVQKCIKHNLEFRPHFKTHQSSDIGRWFKAEGVTGITVSSVKMANYFADNGWNDITIAFPVNIREVDAINALSNEISLTILISDSVALESLKTSITNPTGVMIEIDTGSNRTGFNINHEAEISDVITEISEVKNLLFKGFYSHPGHSYKARCKSEIHEIHKGVLLSISDIISGTNLNREEYNICIGDTPCSSVAANFTGIDQLSPGNLVFYDLMQVQIGACTLSDIAVALACPVVAKYPSRNEIVIHGGAVHLSKDVIDHESIKHYGYPVELTKNGWNPTNKNGYVKALSQEHGIVKCTNEFMRFIHVGDIIGVLPVHSCLCADLIGSYQTLKGKSLNHIRSSSIQYYG